MDYYITLIYRILVIVVLVGFLPLSAITYYNYRLGQRKLEINRILNILDITSQYRNIYTFDIVPFHFAISVLFAMSVSVVGLSALFLSTELGLEQNPNLLLSGTLISSKQYGNDSQYLVAYQRGALLAYGMGFMGAYLWGLQSIFRRYSMNDLLPVAFFRFGLRMIFSSIIALLIYHSVGGFETVYSDSNETSTLLSPSKDGLLLMTVFLVGMFPQRGIKWMATKLDMFSRDRHSSVRPLPLEMIEGMTPHDKERLEEHGIDSCYDLATADFIPLLLKTPYCSRELIDWLLQAKLCVRFGESVCVLREQGFRTISDLEGLDDEYIERLAKDTALTISSLQRAAKATQLDQNITRLRQAASSLGKFWEGKPVNSQKTDQ